MPPLEPQPAPDLEALVARARAGDRAALEAVLASVAPAIHRFGLRMCKNVHDAEDVLQDTLLNVANHLAEFEGRSSLSSWAFAIARSACTRKRRGLKNRPHASLVAAQVEAHADCAPNPEARASTKELASALSEALDALSDEQREVLLLRDIEDLSAPEAAAVLGVSVDALKSRLHRARQALRSALRPVLEPAALPVKPGCPDIAALWSQKLDGDLSQTDCAAMEKHLAVCPSCTAACSVLKLALAACRQVGTQELPSDVQARVGAAVRALVRADG
jgi:RNA polymerase sigma-70 factor (ECF subfamily)